LTKAQLLEVEEEKKRLESESQQVNLLKVSGKLVTSFKTFRLQKWKCSCRILSTLSFLNWI